MVAKTSAISLTSSADIVKKEKIGQGVSGHVFKVQHGTTGKLMAAKVSPTLCRCLVISRSSTVYGVDGQHRGETKNNSRS